MSRPIREAMCVIGGLLYRSSPRCRGHAHRLPAVPGAMDQTVRTAIEGRRSLWCKERRGGRLQVDFCTGLTLDAVGTPTGCRLRREPWIRLDRTAIEGEKPLRCKERRGRRSQEDSRTRLALDAVGTPTGCQLRREPWIRLSGRPSRGGGHCGVRGQGRGKITDALSYRSYPRCRPWPSPAE